jgi:hypothetical protein
MSSIIHVEIEKKLTKSKKGHIFFLSDFRGIGSDIAIRKSLSRLTLEGKVKRIAHGIYYIPVVDKVLGELKPSIETIAEAIAKKEHVRIKPTGAHAMHKLGLSMQVPMRYVYLTDGAPKTIRIGKTIIKFKATTSKKLAMKGKISSMVIQALDEMDLDNIDFSMKQKIKELLKKEDRKKLINDIRLATSEISDFLFTLLKDL